MNGSRRGEIAFVACSNGEKTTRILCNHIVRIAEQRASLDAKSPYESRQRDFSLSVMESGISPVSTETRLFKDGELITKLHESVRGKDVYVVQNTLDPRNPERTSHNIMELLIMLDTVKRSEAAHVTAVVPYLSYCKQERRQGRQPISLKLIIDMIEKAGAERLITMDLHAGATEGFASNLKIQNLFASPLLLHYFEETIKFKGTFVAPDPNAGKTVRHYAKVTGLPMAIAYKFRRPDSMHDISEQILLGDVKGKDAVVIDDQTAGSGTLIGTCKLLKQIGAKDIYAGVTHGMLLEDGDIKFRAAVKEGLLKQLVITNTLVQPESFLEENPYITVLDALHIFSQAIFETHVDGTVSGLYDPRLRKEMFG
jgi:ribose-phosphate pyrophosphokinase